MAASGKEISLNDKTRLPCLSDSHCSVGLSICLQSGRRAAQNICE